MLAWVQDRDCLTLDGLNYMVKSRGVEASDGAGTDKHDVDGPVRVRAGLQALESSHCCDGSTGFLARLPYSVLYSVLLLDSLSRRHSQSPEKAFQI